MFIKMSVLNIVLTSIIGLLTIICGGQGLLFYRHRNRMEKEKANAAKIENEANTAEIWRELVCEFKVEKEELKNELSNYRDKYYKCRDELETVRNENTRLTITHCLVRGCENRVPPSDY